MEHAVSLEWRWKRTAWHRRSDQGHPWDIDPRKHVVLEDRSGLKGVVRTKGGYQSDVRIGVSRSHHFCNVLDLVEDIIMATTVVSLR